MKARRRKAQHATKSQADPISDLFAQEARIRAAHQRLKALQREFLALQAHRKEYDEVSQGIRELEMVIGKLEEDSRIDLAVLERRVSELRLQTADLEKIEKERRQSMREVNKIIKQRDRFLEVRDRGIYVKFHLERLETKANQLRMETRMEEGRIEKLTQTLTTRCSECGAELSEMQFRQARTDAESIWEHKKKHLEQIEKEMVERDAERTALRQEYVKLDKQQQLLPAAYQRLAELEVRRQQAKEAAIALRAADEDAARLRHRLENHIVARSERHAAEEMRTRLKLLKWNPERADQIESEMQELRDTEWKAALLDFLKPAHREVDPT